MWNCDVIVDWADPVEEPDNSTMSKVCILNVSIENIFIHCLNPRGKSVKFMFLN